MDNLSLFMAFAGGVMSFLSPCVLPIIPGYISFVTGLSFAELSEGKCRPTAALLPSLLFVLGFSAVFVTLGASASALGQWLQAYQSIMTRIGGAVIILLGLFVMGWLPLAPLYRERRIHLKALPFGRWSAPLAGAAFALGWTPCVGPILGAILLKAQAVQTAGQGMLLLSVYSLGLGLPFIAAGLLFSNFIGFSKWLRQRHKMVSCTSGALLVAMGVLMLTDNMFRFSGMLQSWFQG